MLAASVPLLVCDMACRVGGEELTLEPQMVAKTAGQAKDGEKGDSPHQPQGCFGGPSLRPAKNWSGQRSIGWARTGSPSRKWRRSSARWRAEAYRCRGSLAIAFRRMLLEVARNGRGGFVEDLEDRK